MKTFAIAATVLTGCLFAGTSYAVDVTTCGQTVAVAATLTADLDCTGYAGHAVVVENGTLDLQGFTLTGGDLDAVHCSTGCTILSTGGQGTVQGAAQYGIRASGPVVSVSNVLVQNNGTGIAGGSSGPVKMTVVDSIATSNLNSGIICLGDGGSLRVERTTASDNGLNGVGGYDCKVTLRTVQLTGNDSDGFSGLYLQMYDATVTGNTRRGIHSLQNLCTQFNRCPKRLRIYDSDISGNGLEGIYATLGVNLTNSMVASNGGGGITNYGFVQEDKPDQAPIYHWSVSVIKDSQIFDNTGYGVQSGGRSSKVSNSQIYGNSGEGFAGRSMYYRGKISIKDSSVTDNGLHGLVMDCETCGLRASGVSATGNGTDVTCGVSQTCADVATSVAPSLKATTCGASYDIDSGFPGTSWGVCSSD